MNKGKQNGITLIALIITIIIMLILVAVTVSVAVNGNLFGKAEEAVDKTNAKVGKLQQDIDYYTGELNNASDRVNEVEHNWTRNGETFKCLNCRRELKMGQQIMYTDTGASSSVITMAKTGYKEDQTITKPSDIKWVVFGMEDSDGDGINESLLITTVEPVPGPYFAYPNGYNNGEEELNRVCKELYGSNARSMTLADIENTLQYRPSGAMYSIVTEEKVEINGKTGTTYKDNWKTIENFNTKLNQLEIWDEIKTASTNTPDGTNTETALGNYTLNEYTYLVATNGQLTNPATNETKNINKMTRDIILGTYNNYSYDLATKVVGATTKGAEFRLEYVTFGSIGTSGRQWAISVMGKSNENIENKLVGLEKENMQSENAKIEKCMLVQHNLSVNTKMRPVIRITDDEMLSVGDVIQEYGEPLLLLE